MAIIAHNCNHSEQQCKTQEDALYYLAFESHNSGEPYDLLMAAQCQITMTEQVSYTKHVLYVEIDIIF